MKAFPVALRAAAPPDLGLPEDDWAAFNLGPDAVSELVVRWENRLASLPAPERSHWTAAVERERLESLGHRDFFERHPQIRPPIVLVPVSAHYSWPKGLKLLGLGAQRCVTVAQKDMRMDLDALDAPLARAHTERQPVLMTVGVFGTTEYGAVDPIDGILAARDRYAAAGLGFPVHVDAAWGGYLLTLFREPGGALRPRAAVTANFEQFPSPAVHAAAAALSRTDSVTIDPHKLGYLPYGAGAFVCRDHRAMSLLSIDADYAFKRANAADWLSRYGQLGRYIIEGSRPGAMAAAVYVTHRVLPLDHANFGRLPAQTLHAVEAFVARADQFAKEYAHAVHVCVPFEPDTNLVCLAMNPCGNMSIAAMNGFVRRLHDELRIDPQVPVQFHEFFASATTLRPDALGREGTRRLSRQLHLPALARPAQSEPEPLLILRHTIMNPFLLDAENGISYIDRYFEFLSRRVAALVDTSCEGLGQMRSVAAGHS
jgi:glutamate/tyrosine decarboxylase-like PLP-dependent enzyme